MGEASVIFQTRLGSVCAKASDRGITRLSLLAHPPPAGIRSRGPASAQSHVAVLRRELRAYLRGEITRFSVRVDLRDMSPFYAAALRAVARIPFGRVRTYGQVARSLGKPRAARAVGQAVARNPVPIVIPCHRVVACDGLGGFGLGLDLKIRLLCLESRRPRRPFSRQRQIGKRLAIRARAR